MFILNYLHKVSIKSVPIHWMTRIELFTPDLEQFPLMYVHFLADKEGDEIFGDYNAEDKQRIFGFVIKYDWGKPDEDGLCDMEVQFICNIPQNLKVSYDSKIEDEICHRIGIADKVSYKDLAHISANSPASLPLLQKIWKDK